HTEAQEKASREQYLAYLRSVVEQFDLEIHTFEPVTAIDREADGLAVTTDPANGEPRTYQARYVVLAIGDMHRPRRLEIPGEDLPHVTHYFREPHDYFQRRLLIIGGRNSAVEAAIRCDRAGADVAISYRQEAFDESSVKYWLLPELKSLIKAGKIDFYPQTVPTGITPTTVTLANTDGQGEPTTVAADAVLAMTGYEMDTSLLAGAGVTLEGVNEAPRVDSQTMETDVPGLFVAGTAAAGTQVRFRLFIENCHEHVRRVVHAITGKDAPRVNPVADDFSLPES
ncbi:MAG: NAD(P)-binding domain-containing protein, partial [Phycisphaeraceae bacterium]|nr:NAD(P)-binding domain-containing protein [Phycisphaeraceae bacterium]